MKPHSIQPHWLQLTLFSDSPAEANSMSELLEEWGVHAITLEDAADAPLYEPEIGTTPLWAKTKVTALLETDTDIPAILGYLAQHLGNNNSNYQCDYQLEELFEIDWQTACQNDVKPRCFANRLWIVPSWHTLPDHTGIQVHLDPGLAFGTGNHPTTQLCLTWLAEQDLRNKQLIDYGCGSGILAIAAIKLGAQQVWAVDIDPQALEATRINAERNGITSAQLITVMPESLPAIKSDVLIANILANPLIELAPHFAELCKTNAQLALSGLLSEQANLVQTHYSKWFCMDMQKQQDEWIILAGRKA